MKINLYIFKNFLKKFWYIFIAEFVALSLVSIIFMITNQKTTYSTKTTLALNSNGKNSSVEYVFQNASDLIKTNTFEVGLKEYYRANTGKELDFAGQQLSLQNKEISVFIDVVSNSTDKTLSQDASKYSAEYLKYLSSDEGIAKYAYASFFKTAPIVDIAIDDSSETIKRFGLLNYVGGIGLGFAITLVTLTISITINKKIFTEQ